VQVTNRCKRCCHKCVGYRSCLSGKVRVAGAEFCHDEPGGAGCQSRMPIRHNPPCFKAPSSGQEQTGFAF